jgi:hypothetical protein
MNSVQISSDPVEALVISESEKSLGMVTLFSVLVDR